MLVAVLPTNIRKADLGTDRGHGTGAASGGGMW